MTYEQWQAMRFALITAKVVIEAQAKGQPNAPRWLAIQRQNEVDNAMAISTLGRVTMLYDKPL